MTTLGIFLIGLFVTAIVAGALALVIVGAIQDGRLAREMRERPQSSRSPSAPESDVPHRVD